MRLKYNDEQHAYWLDGKRCRGVTSVAKIPDDTFYLDRWQRRMVAIGLASEPPLIQQVAAHVADKDKLDAICEKALQAARAHQAADAGTTAHRFTEVLDTGEKFLDTELAQQIQATWSKVLADGGFEVVEGMVERIAVHPDLLVAGTFDRILRRKADGRLFIADLKTGAKAISFPHSIAVQLALYANAPLLAGPLSAKGETTEFEPFPDVDKATGIVIHMPEPDQAEIFTFDIAAGWDCFRNVILPTLDWRKRDNLVNKIASVERRTPPAAPDAKGAGDGDPPAPAERRAWIVDRVKALDADGRRVLARQWPDGVPTLKAFDGHTVEQLHLIEDALIKAEAAVEAPFPPAAPGYNADEVLATLRRIGIPATTQAIYEAFEPNHRFGIDELAGVLDVWAEAGVVRKTEAVRGDGADLDVWVVVKPSRFTPDPFTGLSGEALPDEGPDVERGDVTALRDALEADATVKATVEAWAALAHLDGKRSLSLRQKPSLWRWSVVRALLHAARAGCDDDGLRELAYGATGNEECLMAGVPLGAVIAGLWIDEADRLAHLARHLGTDDLTLEFSADGKPIFSGPAYDAPSAAA